MKVLGTRNALSRGNCSFLRARKNPYTLKGYFLVRWHKSRYSKRRYGFFSTRVPPYYLATIFAPSSSPKAATQYTRNVKSFALTYLRATRSTCSSIKFIFCALNRAKRDKPLMPLCKSFFSVRVSQKVMPFHKNV